MSLTQSATRRLSLLAGSSVFAASLAATAFTGAALAPTMALAADECTPTGATGASPSTNGATADTYACSATTYATGVTYDASGNLTVTKTNTGVTTVTANGVNLTADGTETLTWDSVIGGVTGGTGTAGPVISATSRGSGLITVNTAAVTGTNASITYGVYAESTGGGDISINAAGGTISATNATNGIAGIYAASNGGDITIHQDFRVSQGTATGRLYGVRASTTGDGNLTLSATKGSATGPNMTTTGSSGIAAIDASVQTGDMLVQVVGGVSNTNPTGIGIRTTSRGGDIRIEVIQGSIQGGGSSANALASAIEVDMQGGVTTIDNLGIGRVGSNGSSRRGDSVLRSLGSGSLVFNNNSEMFGAFQLAGFSGGFTLNNSAPVRGWATAGQSVFSQGADTINNLAGGIITIGVVGPTGLSLQRAVLDFNGGADTVNNAGVLVIGENHDTNTLSTVGQTLEIVRLEQFNNSGLIVMGSYRPSPGGTLGAQTDLHYDDVFVLRDSHFHGDEGSRLWLDVNLNRTGQTSCERNADGLAQDVALANPDDGRLRAADCLDFGGSAVSGRTGLIIADVVAGDRGAYNPEGNVLVDMTGSDPSDIDPQAFFIAPETVGYSPTAGGFLDKGLFAYAIGYDPDAEAFKLYGVASPSSLQLPLLGGAANDLWRTATAPWLERRVLQRNDEEAGEDLTPRFWMRGSLSNADRTVADSVSAGAAVLDYDNSYTQKDASLAMGMDLGRGSAFGGQWVVGATAGYVQAKLTYDESINTATFEGGSVGLYSGFTAGPFFHDLVINAALTNLLVDVPSLQLAPVGTLLETDVHTLGAHMETGWRFALGPARLEPLATLSWSQARFDDIEVPADDPTRFGGLVEFDDANSMRAGLGLRFSMLDVAPAFFPIDVSMTGRSMRELDGESTVTIVNLGPDALLTRAFDGAYNEVNAGVSIGDAAQHFGAFLNLGGAWGDDYESQTGSVGMRLRW